MSSLDSVSVYYTNLLCCHFTHVSTLVCVCGPHLGEAVWQLDWCRYSLGEPTVWFMFLTITSFHLIRSTDALHRPEYWDRPVIKFRCFQLHCHRSDQLISHAIKHMNTCERTERFLELTGFERGTGIRGTCYSWYAWEKSSLLDIQL